MTRNFPRVLIVCAIVLLPLAVAAFADDRPARQTIQEEVWAIPLTLPTIASRMWFIPSAIARSL